MLLSSHTLSEVERVTDRLAILRQGRLVVVDSLENLRQRRRPAAGDRVRAPVDPAEFHALPGVIVGGG